MSKTQVGGSHYKKLGISPFDYSMANGLDAMQHTAIKYITRFRDKNGIEDLEKAKDTIQQLIDYESKPTALSHEVEKGLIRVLAGLLPKNKYEVIITTGRGGMWAAAQIGYILDIKHVKCLSETECAKYTSNCTLFVDAICDTGRTLELMNVDTAVLVTKKSDIPTYYALHDTKDAYIDFPLGQYADVEK